MKMLTSFGNFINESYKNDLIVYHRSNNYEHMVDNNFKLEYADDDYSVFGKAIYFASSPDISGQLGKYLCKFKIKLDRPLNLNEIITCEQGNILLQKFLTKNKLSISYYNKELGESVKNYDFNDDYDDLYYGDFFLQLTDIIYEDNCNKYFYEFIKNELGYNSFYHFSDFGTNYTDNKTDYGYCYGIYNTDDIEFIDGPF